MKVAIIDDSADVLYRVCRILKDAGHEFLMIQTAGFPGQNLWNCVPTRNLDEACKRITDFSPDVVLVDHNLGLGGNLTGRQVVQLLGTPEKCLGISDVSQDYCPVCSKFHKNLLCDDDEVVLFLEQIASFKH